MNYYCYESALGVITITEDGEALTGLSFGKKECGKREETALLGEAWGQLQEYLEGRRRTFALPLKLEGTAFQRAVWNALLRIPYGETRSYGEIARQIGKPRACRAVGMANRQNPIGIIVPCHRVIGVDGKLTGYAGGLGVKEKLLRLEGSL